MAEILGLREAVTALVHDGDVLAMEGFTHLIPFAAGHEVIRQGVTDLTLVRMTPDVLYDQIIGAGLARKLVFSWDAISRDRDAFAEWLDTRIRCEVGVEQIRAATGWELRIADIVGTTEPPTPDELSALRFLQGWSPGPWHGSPQERRRTAPR